MEETKEENLKRTKVHRILAHSYVIFLILFLAGVYLDFLFKTTIFTNPIFMVLGIFLIGFASLVILWAQYTSRNLKIDNLSKETFSKGPYLYTRHPTYFSLFILMFGFGILANAFFVILVTFISLLIMRFVFLEKEEEELTKKYGIHYLEYKKKVRL